MSLGETIMLSHGSGGRDMTALLEQLIFPAFGRQSESGDSALLATDSLQQEDARLAFTTDAYTVTPLQFPGGDIGSLAVNGTVNDLAVAGAQPRWLSCSFIIEEGLSMVTLRGVVASMANAAAAADITIVTGDTKVVHRGAADGLFITTSGIGVQRGKSLSPRHIQPGDHVLVSGPLGDHGAAILGARGDLLLDIPVPSDCRPLHTLCAALIEKIGTLRCMRDATRGGVAAVCHEFAAAADVTIAVEEAALPVRPAVRSACELLGLDPLYFANEGTLVAVIGSDDVSAALALMRAQPGGELAADIGCIERTDGSRVELITPLGGRRMLDLPAGELLPRIC